MSDAAPLLEAIEITKLFGDFTANSDVSLTIRAASKHALLGENGAGKSTLVKMIYGILQPSAGLFRWQGQPTIVRNPSEARAKGIGMVFQHFSVFEALNVAENIALALPDLKRRDMADRIASVSDQYGLSIDPERAVYTLSVGEKQRVEIIRCLLQEPRLLIMDEPTSVLTPQEADILFETLDKLSAQGCAILYISHRLEEVKALCDTATILRRGKVVARCDPRKETARSMAELMVGDKVAQVHRGETSVPGPVRLSIDGLTQQAPGEFGVDLNDIRLNVRAGEIVGIAGIAGEGQAELMEALTGETLSQPETIRIDGEPLGQAGPTRRRLAGAAFVPEERNGHAAIGDMTLAENVVLAHHSAEALANRGILDMRRAWALTEQVRNRFDVRAGSDNPVASSLSGGNLQKFVVGREILRNPGVLVVSQPTWGVDAGATSVIRRALVDLARAGAAILVISQDLDEIFEICDRIAVIHHGRLSQAHPRAEMTLDKVGLLMGGAHPEEAA